MLGRLGTAALAGILLCAASAASAGNVTYVYDALGRLTGVTRADGSQVTYAYDAAGNRTQVTATGATNTPPVANNDTASTPFNTTLVVSPLGNDTDANGNSLTITGVTNGAHSSSVTFSSTQVTYVPVAGYSGTDSFTYTISDGNGGTDTATVNVTVTGGANQAPTAANDSVTATRNLTLTVSPMANDTDPGDTFTITGATTPGHGTATVAGNGLTIAYAPTTGYWGADSFNYTITDSGGLTATATVSVYVNVKPTVAADSYTVNAATDLYVMSNDSDLNGDSFIITAKGSGPSHGTAVISGGGTYITYTPTVGYTGSDSFFYQVTDTRGGVSNATVSITVTAGATNTPPVANNDTASTALNTTLVVSPLGNDTDADGNSLAITGVTNGAHSSSVTFSSTQVTYVPVTGYSGADSFTYTISDGNGGTDTATVNVTVTGGSNQAPTAVNDSVTATRNLTLTVSPMANDTDPGDTFTITGATTPGHGTATVAGNGLTIAYAPTTGYWGADSFNYTITDSGGLTATATVSVYVNVKPTVAADSYTVNAATDLYVMSNDSDLNGDSFIITAKGSGPSHGTAVISGGGTYITYTPTTGYTGTDSFYYQVTDARGGISNATVSITVN